MLVACEGSGLAGLRGSAARVSAASYPNGGASEPELFRGLRGGKASLGIITGMKFGLLGLAMVYTGAVLTAAVLIDAVGPMPFSMIGLIPSNPEEAMPVVEAHLLLMVEIRQFGGAFAPEPDVDSARSHRQAGFGMHAVGVAAPPEPPAISAHSRRQLHNMSPWAYHRTLTNFSSGYGHVGFAANYNPMP